MELVGRSSSHYTRVARMFAIDLGVAHTFRPIFDLTSTDLAVYAGNPALKIPILVDAEGPLFGTENICRVLAAGHPGVLLRGAVPDRRVANFEELTLHAMSASVNIVMTQVAKSVVPPKLAASLANTLRYLDTEVDGVLAALPADRRLAFVEVALFCLVRHLPWRGVLDVTPFPRLVAFADAYAARPSALETEYRFDQP